MRSGRLAPQYYTTADGREFYNAAAVLLIIYKTDLTDIYDAHKRAAIRRFQEHVRGLLAAESVRANPRTVDELMWDRFGERFEAAMMADPDRAVDALLAEMGAS